MTKNRSFTYQLLKAAKRMYSRINFGSSNFPKNQSQQRSDEETSPEEEAINSNKEEQKSSLFSAFESVFEFFFDFTVIALIVVAIRTFLVAPYAVNGESMESTIHDGELLIANRFSALSDIGLSFSKIRRGDIVILRPPNNNSKYFIKRVIALPGEEILFEDGEVYIRNEEYPQGAMLIEPYLAEQNKKKTFLPSSTRKKRFKVPAESYFVMGDNRTRSSDSRACFSVCNESNSPFLPKENIVSRSWFVFWPLYDFRTIKNGSAAYGN